ncbi:hypothetical protein RHS01_07951 [Rhizoctonia solani]|uniref:Uncharacterized protein n=1 Tax=Rhizoctonia solani TaxID=456999 RepID=A0A8H7IBZ5_9AGAM|nr:hypothetical protein RHS01_07951 [Rhizoctonia solani]
MVQLRISAAFVVLSAFIGVSALPILARKLPARIPPQAAPNRNTQSNDHPRPRVRDLGAAMRIVLTTVGKKPFEHIQLRDLQEHQRARLLSNQPSPPSSVAKSQQTPPCIPGRLMRMRERRQAGRQDQSRPQQSKQTNPQRQPQSQNNQVSPPIPASPARAPVANNNDIQNGRRRPRRISRLFGSQLQVGNVRQTAVPPPSAAPNTTLEPSQPNSEKGSSSNSSGAASPGHQDGAQNDWHQEHPAEVVEEMAGLGEQDLIADKDEEEL